MDIRQIQSVKQRYGIIGNSSKLNYAIQIALQVAPTELSVLITGESGSGKESFSKIIHQLSHRKHGQFIAINCGAIPGGTIDSELFGHEKGSFTGASEARKGYFEVTNGGSIFLDEIAELPMGTQARLLRVLENKEFMPVGSSKTRKTDIRLVAATHVDLKTQIEKSKFREDLYYRLSTVPIYVPPLRERGDDIELLFRKFATDFAEKHRLKPIQLTEKAKKILCAYRFPGNIRQLKNITEQISVLEIDRTVDADKLKTYLPQNITNTLPLLLNNQQEENQSFNEREILYKLLFDMKKDVTELKKLVLGLLKEGDDQQQSMQKYKDLFHNIDKEIFTPTANSPLLLENQENAPTTPNQKTLEIKEVEDITHKMEDESLSLEKKEKELIIKALSKNKNKRKYAARDLGISERTLYRKIKQYDITEKK